MKRYVEYEVHDGKSIIIEVDEAAPGLVPVASSGEVVAKSKVGFDQALETIGPIAEKLYAKVRELSISPDEVGIEFGLKLGFQAGALIASGSTEANFKVSLNWKPKTTPK